MLAPVGRIRILDHGLLVPSWLAVFRRSSSIGQVIEIKVHIFTAAADVHDPEAVHRGAGLSLFGRQVERVFLTVPWRALFRPTRDLILEIELDRWTLTLESFATRNSGCPTSTSSPSRTSISRPTE